MNQCRKSPRAGYLSSFEVSMGQNKTTMGPQVSVFGSICQGSILGHVPFWGMFGFAVLTQLGPLRCFPWFGHWNLSCRLFVARSLKVPGRAFRMQPRRGVGHFSACHGDAIFYAAKAVGSILRLRCRSDPVGSWFSILRLRCSLIQAARLPSAGPALVPFSG